MKRVLLSFVILIASLSMSNAVAQVGNNYYDVSTVDNHHRHAFREGEVIVKFKPESRVKVSARRGAAVTTAVSSVDAVLSKIGVVEAEQLMPLSGAGGPKRAKAYSGGWVESSDMSKLYRLRLDTASAVSVNDAVEQLQALGEVEYAEPNYLVYTTVADNVTTDATEYEKEPLFKEQWAFNAINLKNVWTKNKITDKRPVIAIIDTGVDTTHPDLAGNIWTNELEADGVEDADDDANGYKDDIHGYDFVNQTARIGDWNGHGTHVAGIAAAEGKNGIGITGANPDALIMPVTVMQSDGTGDIATIIKGIDYAAANGADVINMSIGTYSYSIAMEQSLARAYSKAVLVAAAGNDCLPIDPLSPSLCCHYALPMFPAAFTFVLGVEAGNRDGSRAGFSNYDNNGATFSAFSEEKLYNYELRAPGVAMYSTFPGGKYKALNGTSMASPLVAGAISRLLQCKEYANWELLFGDLIHARKKSSNGMVDFQAAYEITDEDRIPELQLVTYELVDTLADGTPTVNNPNIIPEIPDYRPKASNDSVEYWYNIDVSYNYITYKLTASEEGELRADSLSLGDSQCWKFLGNASDGYIIINKLGYIVNVINITYDNVSFYASKAAGNIAKFCIEQNGVINKHRIYYRYSPIKSYYLSCYTYGTSVFVSGYNRYPDNDVAFIPLFNEDENEIVPNEENEKVIIGGDGDGCPDAGEIVELWPTLRNEWGNAENITISLDVAENEDPEIIEVLDNNVSFGKNLSSYAKAKSEKPIRFKINENCVDGRHIRLVLRATCDNIAEELVHEFTITVENAVEIGGIITRDLTLYPDKHYVVTKNLAIPEGVTLTIKPGTVVNFRPGTGLANDGNIVCKGTPDSLIVLTTTSGNVNDYVNLRFGSIFSKNADLEYVKITGISTVIKFSNANIINSIIEYCRNVEKCYFLNSNICYNNIYNYVYIYDNYITNSNFIENSVYILNPVSNASSKNINNSNIFSNYDSHDNSLDNLKYNANGVSLLHFDNPSYWGSAVEERVRLGVYDAYHKTTPMGYGIVDLSNILIRPSAEAHGIVWKVVVNGYDAQDEFEQLPPLGVGKHKFDVYFNRPMDVSVAPNIAMGVRPPYTQVPVAEDGEWSADSLVYTAYLTIDGKTNSDGLNRIYVDGARDNEYFEIPIEKRRFNVEVAAAGSMATGLMAEAGLGKVTLTWETDEEDFEDLLGYNIYRYTDHIDSTYVVDYNKYGDYSKHLEIKGDTTIVNESVLESDAVEFIDYNVVPGTTYYYVIKQLTTSLNSHALSNAVAVTPLTAQKGDANGSMSVDVADVVTEVAWITNQNPQPFIFEAADVNNDESVNIFDVVGTVNIITAPAESSVAAVSNTVTYAVENGVLYIESDVALGGIQLSLAAPKGTEFTALDALAGFEQMGDWRSDNEYLFLAFSMSGKSIAPGKSAILRIGDAEITEIIVSNVRGGNMLAVDGNTTGIGAVEGMQMRLPYPNPFSVELNVPYIIGQEGMHDVTIAVTDLAGRAVHSHSTVKGFGEHSYTWCPGGRLADGLYLVSLYVDGKLMHTAKVIYKR